MLALELLKALLEAGGLAAVCLHSVVVQLFDHGLDFLVPLALELFPQNRLALGRCLAVLGPFRLHARPQFLRVFPALLCTLRVAPLGILVALAGVLCSMRDGRTMALDGRGGGRYLFPRLYDWSRM